MSDIIGVIDFWLRRSAKTYTEDQEEKQLFHRRLRRVSSLDTLKQLLQPSGYIVDVSTPFKQKKQEWLQYANGIDVAYGKFSKALKTDGDCFRSAPQLCRFIEQIFDNSRAMLHCSVSSVLRWEGESSPEDVFAYIDTQMRANGEAFRRERTKQFSTTVPNHAAPRNFADIVHRDSIHEDVILMLQVVALDISEHNRSNRSVPAVTQKANTLLQSLLSIDLDLHKVPSVPAQIDWPLAPEPVEKSLCTIL